MLRVRKYFSLFGILATSANVKMLQLLVMMNHRQLFVLPQRIKSDTAYATAVKNHTTII